jgi:hypothetical protein
MNSPKGFQTHADAGPGQRLRTHAGQILKVIAHERILKKTVVQQAQHRQQGYDKIAPRKKQRPPRPFHPLRWRHNTADTSSAAIRLPRFP